MKGFVFHGPGQACWQDVPDPEIKEPTDAIIKVGTVTICGTDLHILKGDVPEVRPGTVLGHEAVGEIVEVGSDVRTVRLGDEVLLSCITACGRCRFCRGGSYGQCRGGGGWILGHLVDGTQAEYVRVPYADLSVHPLPECVRSEVAVLFADMFPTSYEVGVLNGHVRPGDTVVIAGAGPIGLAAISAARLFSPERVIAVDMAPARLEAAHRAGADAVADAHEAPGQLVADLTGGLGADVVIEAVGVPESFELCTRMVRPGGHIAYVGVHGMRATVHLEDLWSNNVTITSGLVDTYSTPTLLRMAAAGRLRTGQLVTHTFPLNSMEEAYDIFAKAAETGALKVVLGREQPTDVGVPLGLIEKDMTSMAQTTIAHGARPALRGGLGRRLATQRARLGLTRRETAARVGVAADYLQYVEEHPGAAPSSGLLHRLAEVLETTVTELTELTGVAVDVAPGYGCAASDPCLTELSAAECLALLRSHGVGRLAISMSSGPEIVPVNYSVVDGAIVFRTATGATPALADGRQVAFEVDRIDDAFSEGWSVLVHGVGRVVLNPRQQRRYDEEAHSKPWAGGLRERWMRIDSDRVTGRRITV